MGVTTSTVCDVWKVYAVSTCPDGEIKNEGTKEFLEMQV
jgi:hypothetical protein